MYRRLDVSVMQKLTVNYNVGHHEPDKNSDFNYIIISFSVFEL